MKSAPLRARSADTDPEVEKLQFDLLRDATPGRRIRIALSLSRAVIGLARRAIRRTLPTSTDEEVGLRFVELHYGAELATELRRYLAARRG